MSELQLFAVTASGPVPLPVPPNASRFDDLYRDLALGVYSSLRTFEHNKFLWLDQHIARTVDSMHRLGWTFPLDEVRLRQALHEVCSASPMAEMQVRIDILAEPAKPLGIAERVLVGLMPFTPPSDMLYETGVTVGFAEGLVRATPLIKTASFVEERKVFTAGAEKVYEHLLVNEEAQILEGTSANFYGVRNGAVYTANDGILEGITRKIILDLIREMGLPLHLKGISINALSTLDEAAISSSSRALMPVVNIGGSRIGAGRPGPICQRILSAYRQFVASEIRFAI